MEQEELEILGEALLKKQREDQLCMNARYEILELQKQEADNCMCLPFMEQDCEWNMRVRQAKLQARATWGPTWSIRGTEQYLIAYRNQLNPSHPDHREAWLLTGNLVVPYLDTRQRLELANALAQQAIESIDTDDEHIDRSSTRRSDTPTP